MFGIIYLLVTVAQSGRASACGADCCGFKSRQSPQVTNFPLTLSFPPQLSIDKL